MSSVISIFKNDSKISSFLRSISKIDEQLQQISKIFRKIFENLEFTLLQTHKKLFHSFEKKIQQKQLQKNGYSCKTLKISRRSVLSLPIQTAEVQNSLPDLNSRLFPTNSKNHEKLLVVIFRNFVPKFMLLIY